MQRTDPRHKFKTTYNCLSSAKKKKSEDLTVMVVNES